MMQVPSMPYPRSWTRYRTLCAGMAAALLLSACASTTQNSTVGVNRRQLLLVSSDQINQAAAQSYVETLAAARQKGVLDQNAATLARLKRIANRIIPQVTALRPDAANWNWEVHTINSNALNAYVMPGGKIVFFTGIVDRLNLTDDEIAAIMGHEASHALREHARERASQVVAGEIGMNILAMSGKLTPLQMQGAGLAKQFGMDLPFNRYQESEADRLGLELMARAGYNPNASVSLWKKMQQAAQGEPPAFMSTHPSSTSRITTLQTLIPTVMPLYNSAPKTDASKRRVN